MTVSLSVYRGSHLQRRVPLGDGGLRIGRAPENDLVLEDPEKGVSRFHAELRREHDGYTIVDLNSQNGVYVGNRRVARQSIVPGREFTIGSFRLVLETSDATAPADSEPSTVVSHYNNATASSDTRVRPPSPSPQNPSRRLVIAAAVLLATGALAVVFALTVGHQPPSPDTHPVAAVTSTTTIPAPPKPVDPNVALLQEAEQLFADKQFEAALEKVDAVLSADPTNEGAKELRTQIQEAISLAHRPPPEKCDEPVLVGKKPGESVTARCKRSQKAAQEFQRGKAAYDAGDYDQAMAIVNGMWQEFGDYEPATELAGKVRTVLENKKKATEEHYQNAQRLETTDPRQAVGEYTLALDSDPKNVEIAARRDRLRQDLQARVAKLKKEADFFKNVKDRTNEVLRLKQAIDLALPDDPQGQAARARLTDLGVKYP